MKKLSLLLLMWLMVGCYNDFGEEYQHWFFEKGQHRGQLVNKPVLEKYNISKIENGELYFNALFSEECQYVLPNNYQQINKLYGVMIGSDPHDYSARIGWMWKNEQMLLYAYWYVEGQRDYKLLGVSTTNKTLPFIVRVSPSGYYFNFDGVEHWVEANVPQNRKKYRMYPYFGGKYPAPHQMQLTTWEY